MVVIHPKKNKFSGPLVDEFMKKGFEFARQTPSAVYLCKKGVTIKIMVGRR